MTSQEIYKKLGYMKAGTVKSALTFHELFFAYASEEYEKQGKVTVKIGYYLGVANAFLQVAEDMNFDKAIKTRKNYNHSKLYQEFEKSIKEDK